MLGAAAKDKRILHSRGFHRRQQTLNHFCRSPRTRQQRHRPSVSPRAGERAARHRQNHTHSSGLHGNDSTLISTAWSPSPAAGAGEGRDEPPPLQLLQQAVGDCPLDLRPPG